MKPSNPLVSIIIPLHNKANYVQECIHSCIHQTYQNIEFIVVENGSSDDGLSVVNSIKDERIIIYDIGPSNASAARNYGIQQSKGEYLHFLDADDYISLNKIEKQLEPLLTRTDSISYSSTIHFLNATGVKYPPTKANWRPYWEDSFEFLLKLYGVDGNPSMITTSAWLIPRAVVEKAGPWNESLTYDDDGEYFCRIVLKAKEVFYIQNVYDYYRKFGKGTISTNKSFESSLSRLKAIKLKEKHLFELSNQNRVKTVIARQYWSFVMNTYPMYKELTNEALKAYSELGSPYFDVKIGGIVIEKIKHIFGWKIAKYLSFIFNQSLKMLKARV